MHHFKCYRIVNELKPFGYKTKGLYICHVDKTTTLNIMATKAPEVKKSIKKFVSDFKINKTHIAASIGMPNGTFKNKWGSNPAYNFSEEEIEKIEGYLKKIKNQLNKIFPADK